jgi:hypothetical protein
MSSKSQTKLKKLQPFVDAISQHGAALDILSNTYPIAMAPPWGGVRILLYVYSHFGILDSRCIMLTVTSAGQRMRRLFRKAY